MTFIVFYVEFCVRNDLTGRSGGVSTPSKRHHRSREIFLIFLQKLALLDTSFAIKTLLRPQGCNSFSQKAIYDIANLFRADFEQN